MTMGIEEMDRRSIGERLLRTAGDLDILTDDLEETVALWISGEADDDDMRDAVVTEILDGFEFRTEVSVNVSCCCDDFFDMKLEEGFRDDEEIRRYLKENGSEILPMMIRTFSFGFSIIVIMEDLGMHEDAKAFAKQLADVIDADIERKAFFDAFVLDCLGHISSSIRRSLRDDDPAGWMVCDPDAQESG